ncbi:hypothetical protein AVEN_94367-1 [Araneus ventricosus]|uniref:Uncharacterized protein n=1 Tax=Araneus ventricosus TaxID=182803 RepID=A0A4Y2E9Q2_ARAVE|nr:hypothetical protein AVEN_94367-1 [Araneus ventricosus]
MHEKRLRREPSLLLEESLGRRVLSNVTLRGLRQHPVETIVNEIASLANIRGPEVNNSGIDQLVKKHNQELTTEELMEFHCVSQQEVMEESLSEEEEVTVKHQSSNEIREMLKEWKTFASYIEKHHLN